MRYYFNETDYTIKKIITRIKDTDLVPSIEPIKNSIEEKMNIIKNKGIENLSELRKIIKNKDKMVAFAKEVGIEDNYMILLRREIEGWIPKKNNLNEFKTISRKTVEVLEKMNIKTTDKIFDLWQIKKEKEKIIKEFKNEVNELEIVVQMSDLTRVRWVSPVVAQILFELGYENPKKISETNAEKLYRDFDRLNIEKGYFKGKIGLRDINRVISEAKFVIENQ